MAQNQSGNLHKQVFYRTVKIENLEIFYREAGDKDSPTIILMHGFPTDSHMFRNLIPMLAQKYHVIAPDYPGYGRSSTQACMILNTASTIWLASWINSLKS